MIILWLTSLCNVKTSNCNTESINGDTQSAADCNDYPNTNWLNLD